ncbi:hypothetical protein BG004_008228 [Podila humilis]|nr:hypothetical protein BG004_008228 [Podila humilis]
MTRTHEFQTFQLNHLTRQVSVTSGAEGDYVLLEDIRDAFHFADEFMLDGESVPFLEDENQERIFPRRIAAFPGRVLTVVPLADKDIQSIMANPSPATVIGDTTLFETRSTLSPFSPLSPLSSPPRGPSRANSQHRLSDVSLEEKIHTMLESHHHRLQEDQEHHKDTLMEQLVYLQTRVGHLQQDLHRANTKIAEQMLEMAMMQSKSLELQKQSFELQQVSLDKLMRLQTSISAVLTQTFELHEYPAPRLFIILPEVGYEGLNPSSMLSNSALTKFRLYFLCECGAHTTPSGSHQLNHIHIARHEGYEITRPTEFFGKYGPYVLRLLLMLKNGISIASLVVPALSATKVVDLPSNLVKALDDKVSMTIQYLSVYQGGVDCPAPGFGPDRADILSNTASASASVPTRNARQSDDEDGFIRLEGADFRQLSSFLKKKDQDRALGNLFRTVTEEGHVKWICLDHYRSTYHLKQDRQFESEVTLNNGTYDHQLGKVSVVLTSSYTAEAFMVAMTRARAFNELELHLRNYSYQDLRHLGISLQNTNVSKLTLRAHQYKDFMAVGKRRIHAILKMMNAGKIRCFHFKQIKDLFPSKTVVPNEMPSVHSLELTRMTLKDGHETFGDILQSCKNLSDLRLTEVPLKPQRLTSVMRGLAFCKGLCALSLRACDIPEDTSRLIADTLKPLKCLRELDLGFNLLEDDSICAIIESVGNRLEKLWLPYTGFGDASAMALERVVSNRLKCLDISNSANELGLEGMESIIRLTSRLKCTELVMPRTSELSDESCSKMVLGLNFLQLDRLEIEGSSCGDLTAAALATVLSHQDHAPRMLSTLRIDLPNITLKGAHLLGRALGHCHLLKLSLRHSHLFQPEITDRGLLQDLFKSAASQMTMLDLRRTNMSDEVAMVLCESLTEMNVHCRLEYLDVSRNKMTVKGASSLLESLQCHPSLRVLRIESASFAEPGSIGPATRQFLQSNSSVERLSVSHVSLKELADGLSSMSHCLKCIEVQYVDGAVDDIFAWGDFLQSSQNKLLRLVIKHANVCEDEKSLEYLCQCLKQNKTILDLEWEFDQGWKVDSFVLQRYIERNREQWRKSAESRTEDLVKAGMDLWTVRAVSQSHD